MFEPMERDKEWHIRLRQIALILGVVSLLLFIASYIWYEVNSSKEEYSILPYYSSDIEVGLTWGAIMGGFLAAGLWTISFNTERKSKK